MRRFPSRVNHTNASNYAESMDEGDLELNIELGQESDGAGASHAAPQPEKAESAVRKIQVGPVESPDESMIGIVIQPLDQFGAVIPIAGKVRIRVRDSGTNRQVASWNYTERETQHWLETRENESPGIHIELPRDQIEVPGPSSQILVDYAVAGRKFNEVFQIRWDDDTDQLASRRATRSTQKRQLPIRWRRVFAQLEAGPRLTTPRSCAGRFESVDRAFRLSVQVPSDPGQRQNAPFVVRLRLATWLVRMDRQP